MIENVHGNGICSSVGEMSPDAPTEFLVGLADVDRLTVIVVEDVHPACGTADHAVFVVLLSQEY